MNSKVLNFKLVNPTVAIRVVHYGRKVKYNCIGWLYPCDFKTIFSSRQKNIYFIFVII